MLCCMKITDSQLVKIKHHFREEAESRVTREPKPVPSRAILEAVLWIPTTGAQWRMSPQCYSNYKTTHLSQLQNYTSAI